MSDQNPYWHPSKTRVLKYGTGDVVPEDAIYLTTNVEVVVDTQTDEKAGSIRQQSSNLYVWHYVRVVA